jgi:uncharacterized protein YccT (UPF0319 family)
MPIDLEIDTLELKHTTALTKPLQTRTCAVCVPIDLEIDTLSVDMRKMHTGFFNTALKEP